MKLIVGLGNPETRYDGTRHNVGFEVLDAYSRAQGIEFQLKDKFKAELAETGSPGDKVLLLKPRTYYNLSGEAVRAVADFYKIDPQDILVIHDELALPFGRIRTRLGGSDAGNNGIKSINQHLGPDTARVRIGIANQLREQIPDADFVLAKFTATEREDLDRLNHKATELIDDFIGDRFETTTH